MIATKIKVTENGIIPLDPSMKICFTKHEDPTVQMYYTEETNTLHICQEVVMQIGKKKFVRLRGTK